MWAPAFQRPPDRAAALLGAALLATGSTASAQRLFVDNYTEANGLPGTQVLDVRQAPTGLLWFASRSGVHEFDGTSWQRVLEALLPEGQGVAFIRFDELGEPWILCDDGTVATPARGGPTRPVPTGAEAGGLIHDFDLQHVGGRAQVAVTVSEGGLLVWEHGAWQVPDLGGAEAQAVAVEACFGRLFIGTPAGLRVLPGSVSGEPSWMSALPAGPVLGLSAEGAHSDQEMWVLGDGWIVTVRADGSLTRVADGLPTLRAHGNSPACVVPDGRGGALYGAPWVLYHVDARTRRARRLDRESGLAVDGVHALTRDSSGLVWGASRLAAFKILCLDAGTLRGTEGLLADEVTALAELPDGRIVAGHQGGLTLDTLGQRTAVPLEGAEDRLPSHTRIMDLCVDGEGRLFAAASALGVGCIRADGNSDWFEVPQDADGWANAVHADTAGGVLVGTPRGLLRLSNGAFETVEDADLGRPFVRRIEQARDGTTYLATTNGIWRGRAGSWSGLLPDHAQRGFRHYFTCFEDAGGQVWCGGGDGLWRVEGDHLARAGPAYDVQRPVYSLTQDGRGRLWIGTDFGVAYSDGERLVALDWLAEETGYEANRAAALGDRDGNVWIGTTEALSVFESTFDIPTSAPILELLGIEIGGKVHEHGREIRTSGRADDVLFRARARSFLGNRQIEFRSRLVGFTGWEVSRGPTVLDARYSGLPPGQFRFEVQARAPGGDFSSVVSSPSLTILGPIWTRWWFLTSAIAAAAGATFALYRSILLKQHAARLEREIAARTKDLENSLYELAKTDRLRALGLLGAGIAHDLRNVLTVLTGNLSLLAMRHSQADGSSELFEATDRALDRATQLAAQLQTFATGGTPLTMATSLASLVRESARMVMSGSRVSIDLDLEEDLWPVEADQAQMRQVIENLLVNARQCQPEGGWIRARARNAVLDEGSAPESDGTPLLAAGRYVLLTVTDGGPGIAPDIARRVFDPFFTTKRDGTGLGLATALSIVRRHGGNLSFEPAPSGGTTFRLLLPTSEAPLTTPRLEPASTPLIGEARVLVVDDEAPIRELLCSMLARLGFDAQSARNSSEAQRLVALAREERRPFQIALLDLTLPGDLAGPEILARLRRIDPDLRAVASSGYSKDDVLARPEEYGFQAALPKPYRVDDLQRALNSARGEAPLQSPSPATDAGGLSLP